MKEEVYEQVRTLFKEYGPFDYVFWDGGWLAQRGSDRDAAFFWEPGQVSRRGERVAGGEGVWRSSTRRAGRWG